MCWNYLVWYTSIGRVVTVIVGRVVTMIVVGTVCVRRRSILLAGQGRSQGYTLVLFSQGCTYERPGTALIRASVYAATR